MPQHFESLDDLIAAAPASGPVGGPHVRISWGVSAFVDVAGATWAVHEDTRAERLTDLPDHLKTEPTPFEKRAVDDAPSLPERLSMDCTYTRPYQAPRGRLIFGRPTHALCPTYNVEAPIRSECAFCGAEIPAG